MKRYLSVLLLICFVAVSVAGCGDKGAAQPGNSNSEKQNAPVAAAKSVDVDLTALSSTMVYAEVVNILSNPGDYMGKIIRMNGLYYASYYDVTDLFYHYVIIQDATACCAQGLEFMLSGDKTYPEDYPDDEANIEVVGVFGSYDELGSTYYYLTVDDISYPG